MFKLYTDGACLNGKTGWAAVIVEGDEKTYLKDKGTENTSNRIELQAAIKGLSYIPKGSEVIVYSDSLYLVNTMLGKWKRKANLDLWQELDRLSMERKVKWQWAKRDEYPELKEAHQLAERMALGEGVKMVDISPKPITEREATAKAIVRMKPTTLSSIKKGEISKGDVIALAQIAGIMGAKKTAELIPLCHPILIEDIQVEVIPNERESLIEIRAKVKGEGKTGMEMEALTAVAVSALTVYDMCKSIDPAMSMEIKLIKKSGGKSGIVELEP